MTTKNKYLRLLADIGIFGIGNFLVKLIQYFLLPLYTLSMSTEAYGTGELLNNLTELLLPVMTLALYEGLFRFSIDPERDKDALLFESVVLVLKVFVVVTVAVCLLQYFIYYKYTWYLIFVLFSYSMRMLFASFARGSGYAKSFSISGVINAGSLALCSVIFVAYLHWGIEGYLLAIGLGHAASAIFLAINVRIPQHLSMRKRDKALLKALLYYSIPLIFSTMAWWVTSMSSRYIVLFFYGAAMAGLYTAANKLPAIISMVAQVFQQAWQLNSARELENQERESFYSNVLRYYVTIIFLLCAVTICATPVLAKITLHNDFYMARYYIPLMMLGVCIHCTSAYFGSLLLTLEQSKPAMHGMMIGSVVNIVLALILVGPLKIVGVLIASNIAYLIILVHRIYTVEKYIHLNKHLSVQIPLFIILCVQAVLMSVGSNIGMTVSMILLVMMLIFSAYSFRKDLRRMMSSCKSFINKS